MFAPPVPSPGRARFLAERNVAVLTARDEAGRLWTAPLVGPPGFLDMHGDRLAVYALPCGRPGRPPVGQRVGIIVMDLPTRRRLRINGLVLHVGAECFGIVIEQAFGNYRKYIQARELWFADDHPAVDETAALLVPDFSTGRVLQLSGSAVLEWSESGAPGDDGLTWRRVRLTVAEAVTVVAGIRG